jgi:hypothetical protein
MVKVAIMKKLVLVLVLLLAGGVIAWHLYVAASMDHEYRLVGNATLVSVNPVNDVVTWDPKIEVDTLNRENPPIGHMGEVMAADDVEKRFTPEIPPMEYRFNLYARQYLDIYALLLPYRVIIDPYK